MNVGRVIVFLRRGLAAAVTVLAAVGCVPGAAASGAADPAPVAPTLPPPRSVPSTPVPTPTASEIPPSPSPTPGAPGADLPLAAVSYRLPLTVRHVTADGVTLDFELSDPAAGDVFLRPAGAGGPVIERPLAPDQTRHRLTVDGLTPGAAINSRGSSTAHGGRSASRRRLRVGGCASA
jgi:hypothetical protein